MAKFQAGVQDGLNRVKRWLIEELERRRLIIDERFVSDNTHPPDFDKSFLDVLVPAMHGHEGFKNFDLINSADAGVERRLKEQVKRFADKLTS